MSCFKRCMFQHHFVSNVQKQSMCYPKMMQFVDKQNLTNKPFQLCFVCIWVRNLCTMDIFWVCSTCQNLQFIFMPVIGVFEPTMHRQASDGCVRTHDVLLNPKYTAWPMTGVSEPMMYYYASDGCVCLKP